MSFESFVKIYMDDMENRIREHTWQTKISIIESKLLPYFKGRKMSDIAPKDIIQWQNEMIAHRDKDGKKFSARVFLWRSSPIMSVPGFRCGITLFASRAIFFHIFSHPDCNCRLWNLTKSALRLVGFNHR